MIRCKRFRVRLRQLHVKYRNIPNRGMFIRDTYRRIKMGSSGGVIPTMEDYPVVYTHFSQHEVKTN